MKNNDKVKKKIYLITFVLLSLFFFISIMLPVYQSTASKRKQDIVVYWIALVLITLIFLFFIFYISKFIAFISVLITDYVNFTVRDTIGPNYILWLFFMPLLIYALHLILNNFYVNILYLILLSDLFYVITRIIIEMVICDTLIAETSYQKKEFIYRIITKIIWIFSNKSKRVETSKEQSISKNKDIIKNKYYFVSFLFWGFIYLNTLILWVYFFNASLGDNNLFFRNQGDKTFAISSFHDIAYYVILTFSTVGYGDINPKGVVGQAIAAFISLLGMMFTILFASALISRIVSKPK